MCSDMSDMCERDPVCDIPPIHGKSAKDTRAGRSAAVDMAEPGDTLEKIAADELARILKLPEVLKGISDNAVRKARQEKMLTQIDDEMEMRRAAVIRAVSCFCCITASYTTILLVYCSHIPLYFALFRIKR